MTSPQVEDGYTRIANELLDAIIQYPFTKRQYKVMLLVLRKTYGFNKKTDDMTVTQIANLTGLTRPHASGTLAELIELNCVLKRDGRHGYVIGINKNYGTWGASQNGTCPKTGTTPSQNGTSTVPKRDTQKTTPKDNTKRDALFDQFWEMYPRKKSKGQAEKAWQKVNPDEQLFLSIIDGLRQAKKSGDWKQDGGKFIPYPATWLNARGWEDEHETETEIEQLIPGGWV